MLFRAGAVVLFIAGLFIAAGCLTPRQVNLEGRSCPCAESWVCDTATDICIRRTSGVRSDGGGLGDTSGRGDSGGGGDTGGDAMRDGSLADTMTVPGAIMLWYEAEAGTIEAPMESAAGDAMASGMSYVAAAETDISTGAPPATGKVTFDVRAPNAGTYRIWGRVFTPDPPDPMVGPDNRDSFWVRVNGVDPFIQWNNIGPFPMDYGWDDFHDSGKADATVDFDLTMGLNRVEVAYREGGARLDKIVVTDDLAFVPLGLGE